jgi:hypothetical protein
MSETSHRYRFHRQLRQDGELALVPQFEGVTVAAASHPQHLPEDEGLNGNGRADSVENHKPTRAFRCGHAIYSLNALAKNMPRMRSRNPARQPRFLSTCFDEPQPVPEMRR